MTVFITGGTGFVGANVLKQLAARGEDGIAYDLYPDHDLLEAVLGPDVAKVKVVQGDILDLPTMVRTARQHKADRIVHLAYALGRATEYSPLHGSRINVEGTDNVFEMAGYVGITRVAWASSIAVFGPRSRGADGVVPLDAPFDPQTIYGGCKITNELSARRYSYIYGLEPVGLRFPVVYGTEIRRGWAAFLCHEAESLLRTGTAQAPLKDHLVNWGYVDDIAGAVVRALEVPRPPRRVYTLAGFPATVKDISERVASHFPGGKLESMDYPLVWLETNFDLSATRADLGWEPVVDPDEGTRRIVEYYRAKL